MDWSRVQVLLADERWVPADSERSNSALVRQNLLRGPASKARFSTLFSEHQTAPQVAQALSDQLGTWTQFDAVILGMGNDGHTASLFPDAPQIDLALSKESDAAMVLTPVSQPEQRISLTPRVLTNTRFLALHIEGAQKREVLEQALEDGAVEEMPVRAILRNDIPQAQVYWCE